MSVETNAQSGFLFSRRFLPLFATQFLGAFNDNFFRFAMATLIVFSLGETAGGGGLSAPVIVTIAAGAFMLPFFLLSGMAGQIADRFDKSRVIRWVKLFEIVCMAVAAAGFLLNDPWILMAALVLMGTQSTFFGPVKYGILPDHLAEDELVAANGVIEAGTYLAILLGTIGGIQVMHQTGGNATIIAACVLGLAVAGTITGFLVPRTAPGAPDLKIDINIVAQTGRMIAHAAERRDIFLSILGISWFWLVGFLFLSQMQTLTADVIHGNENLSTVFMALFSLGIGLGSLLCVWLLKGEISARTVPIGALGMALFSFDLYLACNALPGSGAGTAGAGVGTVTVAAFFQGFAGWRIAVDLAMISVFGGLFIVPLYAIVQARSEEAHRARAIAANNVLNAAFMVVGAGAAAGLLHIGYQVTDIFLVLALANVLVAIHVCRLLPDELLRAIFASFFRLLFRIEVKGMEHLRDVGDRAVIVVNHVSFLDGALLATFLPAKPIFAIDTNMARNWWVKPFLSVVQAYPLDPTSPLAIKGLVREVQSGKHCVIFPEGRLTTTGALMKVYEGPGMLADKADAPVVPIRLDGLQHSYFTRLKGRMRRRLFPKVTITVLPPRDFATPDTAPGGAPNTTSARDRRRAAGLHMHDLMTEMLLEADAPEQSLFDALLDARAAHGRKSVVVDDVEQPAITYNRLVTASFALGGRIARMTERGEAVGLLLPNAAGAAVTFFALQATGRVPAMLNFTAGEAALEAACRAAEIKTVLTSRLFIEKAGLDDLAKALEAHMRVVYLEDIREEIGLGAKLRAALAGRFARIAHGRYKVTPDEPSVILFTSGSEGAPKGVVLSHRNLLTNCQQLSARIDFGPSDTALNALPVFHSFGLTGGMILPILAGAKTFMYPSPLHYRIVPEIAYGANATIMFGTDTFLAGYARVADPYDFYAMRYVFAGAEKLKDETRRMWSEKFGVRVLEGYGATECAPVIAVNTPMHNRPGTVGRLLPGIRHRLEPVDGVDAGGRLHVTGPNVMLGYLKDDAPGKLQPPQDGWYDTGDIVAIDADGYVSILGRAKRFAKIAGEMVSLGAVEDLAADLWPDASHAAVNLPDERKGERIVLVTTQGEAAGGAAGDAQSALAAHAKQNGVPALAVPAEVMPVPDLPLLGTGKIDHPAVRVLVEGKVGETGA